MSTPESQMQDKYDGYDKAVRDILAAKDKALQDATEAFNEASRQSVEAIAAITRESDGFKQRHDNQVVRLGEHAKTIIDLTADNAALVEWIQKLAHHPSCNSWLSNGAPVKECTCYKSKILATPHPVADLLQKLEEARGTLPGEVIAALNLDEHQSLVDLMFKVQLGECSCRRAATEMTRLVGERMKLLGANKCESCDQWTTDYNTDNRGEIVLCDKCAIEAGKK